MVARRLAVVCQLLPPKHPEGNPHFAPRESCGKLNHRAGRDAGPQFRAPAWLDLAGAFVFRVIVCRAARDRPANRLPARFKPALTTP